MNVGRSRFSQRPLVAVNEFRPVRKVVVPDEHPFFPLGPVVVDLEGVNANLGLEEGGGTCGGERWSRCPNSCCTR